MPGGGVEPPRPEGRRILSPLRLPVPPSRQFVEVLDFTACFTFYSFVIQNNECETVQENVEVFADFHRSLSLAHEVLCGSSRAKMPPGQVLTGQAYEILPPIALTAPGDVRFARKRVLFWNLLAVIRCVALALDRRASPAAPGTSRQAERLQTGSTLRLRVWRYRL